MLLRKAIEALAVALSIIIGDVVLDLVMETPVTTTTWLVSAAIPFALLVLYWLFIEPRHRRDKTRGLRFRDALERAIERGYKTNKAYTISEEGLLFEDAPDHERHAVYGKLGIADLFQPTPSQGAVIFRAKAAEGRALLDRERAGTPPTTDEIDDWERLAGLDVQRYRGAFEEQIFASPSPTSSAPDAAARMRVLARKIKRLEAWAKTEDRKAIKQAERRIAGQDRL